VSEVNAPGFHLRPRIRRTTAGQIALLRPGTVSIAFFCFFLNYLDRRAMRALCADTREQTRPTQIFHHEVCILKHKPTIIERSNIPIKNQTVGLPIPYHPILFNFLHIRIPFLGLNIAYHMIR